MGFLSTSTSTSTSTSSWSSTTIDLVPLCIFSAALIFFHGSEFALAYAFQRKTLSRRCEFLVSIRERDSSSSLRSHQKLPETNKNKLQALLVSWPYALAMASAVVEYLLESILVSPWLRRTSAVVPSLQTFTTAVGCLLVAAGEALRKAAMLTAAQAFTHDLAFKKEPTHGLVTRGVYSMMRHPGYAGFALWAIGTQLVLRNPFCAVAFAAAVSRFLSARVEAEEALLVGFFGQGYESYSARVKRWLWR